MSGEAGVYIYRPFLSVDQNTSNATEYGNTCPATMQQYPLAYRIMPSMYIQFLLLSCHTSKILPSRILIVFPQSFPNTEAAPAKTRFPRAHRCGIVYGTTDGKHEKL